MICSFLLVVCVSMFGFAFVFYKIGQIESHAVSIKDQEMPRYDMITSIQNNALMQIAALRGYALGGQQKFVDEYQKAAEENTKLEAELIRQARTPEGKKMVEALKAEDEKYSNLAEKKVFPLVAAGKTAEAIAVINNETSPVAKSLSEKAQAYEQRILKQTTDSLIASTSLANETKNISIIIAILSSVIGIAIGYLLVRNIANAVNKVNEVAQKVAQGDLTVTATASSQDEVGQLAAATNTMVSNLKSLLRQIGSQADQVAASSQQLTASADQSAQAANLTAGSVTQVAEHTEAQIKAVDIASNISENIVSELQEVSANVVLVTEKAEKAALTATEGGKSSQKAIQQMQKAEKTVQDSALVVENLGKRSKEIGEIVDTIAGIAGQTNLLALNAAIEAARAGEQGKGFAVVAEEVRKLAEQSQEAAKHIAQLINEIQVETEKAIQAMATGTREVKSGADVVNETGTSFEQIVKLVEGVSVQVRDISTNIHSVASGSEKILESVQKVNQLCHDSSGEIQNVSAATEEQSASMEEIASASQSLARMAQDMQEAVSKFHI